MARLAACTLGVNHTDAANADAGASQPRGSAQKAEGPRAGVPGEARASAPAAAESREENAPGAANSSAKPPAKPRRKQEVIWRGSRHKTKQRHTMLMRAASEPRRSLRAKAQQAQANPEGEEGAEGAFGAGLTGIVPGAASGQPRRSSLSSWVPADGCAADDFLMQLQKRATVARVALPGAKAAMVRG